VNEYVFYLAISEISLNLATLLSVLHAVTLLQTVIDFSDIQINAVYACIAFIHIVFAGNAYFQCMAFVIPLFSHFSNSWSPVYFIWLSFTVVMNFLPVGYILYNKLYKKSSNWKRTTKRFLQKYQYIAYFIYGIPF
jgi:hypothetical protein